MSRKNSLTDWLGFIELFNKTNVGRPTRIGVYVGAPDSMQDYWLADGLPLQGIDIDPDHEVSSSMQVVLGGNGKAASRNFTHVIKDPRYLKITLSASGVADGLEIDDGEGNSTVLQFEGK